MADGITVIQHLENGAGGVFQVLFLYDITPRIETFDGDDITITPSINLPSVVTDLNLLTNMQEQDLDRGDLAFEVRTVPQPEDLSDALMFLRIKEVYLERKIMFLDAMEEQFRHSGVIIPL